MKKRFLSLALSAALTLSVLTPAALAAEYVQLTPFQYEWIQDSASYHKGDGLIQAQVGGNWEADLLDANGNVVVSYERYDSVGEFSDGLAPVHLDSKYGFVDSTGKEVIPVQFDGYPNTYFSEGMAAVRRDGKWGFIDTTGKEVVPLQYDDAGYFSEGLASVELDGKWGFIDTTGKVVIPFQYSSGSNKSLYFSDGLAQVILNGKHGYIDKTGKMVVTFQSDKQYDDVNLFTDGSAIVRLGEEGDSKTGYVDANGKEILPLEYMMISTYGNILIAANRNDMQNETFHIFDKTGVEFLSGPFTIAVINNRDGSTYIGPNSEGLGKIQRTEDGKWGYINDDGQIILPFQYDRAGDFSQGMAPVCLDDKWGFIDQTGKVVLPFQYEYAKNFADGLAAVKSGGKWGVIDTAGNLVIPFQYENIKTGYGKLVAAEAKMQDGYYGAWGQKVGWGLLGPMSTVPPSPCAVTLDGKAITLNAYLFTENGGGSNYVMLRDIAMLLNGTEAQFDVSWSADTGISITKGNAYTPVGGELQSKGTGEKGYTANSSTITVDGKLVSLGGYTIESNNYFKLRDLGNALGFTVDWDQATGTVVLSTNG